MRPVSRGAPYLAWLLIPILATVLSIGACKKSPPAEQQAPVTVKPQPKPQPKAPPKAQKPKEPTVFSYSPKDYRDPFASLVKLKEISEEIPEEELTPLQRVSVADMRLSGIIIMGRKVVAHVLTPDGKAHIVSIGTPMGRNRGKVTKITSETVVVEEEFKDYTGQKVIQETILRLREEEGESS
ncbi:MAG: pilus assembly protein PilP [bacterium]|nr:MAG: pilus assembly protein PilP [bacterium]